jgi:hypothetical protein
MVTQTKAIFEIRATVREIEPAIYRVIQIPEDTQLPRLHSILQLLFNWQNCHLHEFVAGDRTYGMPDPDLANDPNVIDEKRVPVFRIVSRIGDKFEYGYDFGDGWRVDLVLDAILLPEPDVFYPRCIAGARNGPLEDSGGPFGYAMLIEALRNRRHPEHKRMREWCGPFDAEGFSLGTVNQQLRVAFRARKKSDTPTVH